MYFLAVDNGDRSQALRIRVPKSFAVSCRVAGVDDETRLFTSFRESFCDAAGLMRFDSPAAVQS